MAGEERDRPGVEMGGRHLGKRLVSMREHGGCKVETQWTTESFRKDEPQTIPVLIHGQLFEATIRKFEDQEETTIQIGDDYFGTTWSDILASLNEGRPLEIIPNPDHFQMRS
jgi:hypothetical protein